MNILNRILCLVGSIALLFILIQFYIAYTFLYILTVVAGSVSSLLLGGGGLGLHTLGIDLIRMIFKQFRIVLYLNLSQNERDEIILSKERSGRELNLIDDIKAISAPGRVSFTFGALAIIFVFVSVL